MRFRKYSLNQQRTRKKFAFFPITINGEIRWLEMVEYTEEWYKPDGYWCWVKIKFNN